MTEPIGSGPRAFFTCLSKKCRTDEGQKVYELSTAAKFCPECGSKRITRVWTGQAPGMLRSGSREMQRTIDQAGSQAVDTRNAQNALAVQHEKASREFDQAGLNTRIRMVPVTELGKSGFKLGGSEAVPRMPAMGGVESRVNHPPRPGEGSQAWKPTPADIQKAGGR